MTAGDTFRDVTVNISGVVIQPGDVLVLAIPKPCTRAEADEMRDRIHGIIADVEIVFVLANDLAVYRAGKLVTDDG